jgi:hypothetical protein
MGRHEACPFLPSLEHDSSSARAYAQAHRVGLSTTVAPLGTMSDPFNREAWSNPTHTSNENDIK